MTLEEKVNRRRQGISKEIHELMREKWILDRALLNLRTGEPAQITEARMNHELGVRQCWYCDTPEGAQNG